VFKGQVLNGEQLNDLVDGLEQNRLMGKYSHLLTGYIGSTSFLQQVMSTLAKLRKETPGLVYVCDPVLGDDGKLYVPEELVEMYKTEMVPLATILTPNQFEVRPSERATDRQTDRLFNRPTDQPFN
jgi:pyridoxine kinase